MVNRSVSPHTVIRVEQSPGSNPIFGTMDQGNKPVHPAAESQAWRLHTYHIELSAPDSLSPSVRHQLDRLLWLQAWHGNSRPATKMIDARRSFLRRRAELSGLSGEQTSGASAYADLCKHRARNGMADGRRQTSSPQLVAAPPPPSGGHEENGQKSNVLSVLGNVLVPLPLPAQLTPP